VNKPVQRVAIAMSIALSSMTITACSSSSGGAAVEVPVDAAVETGPSRDANCDPALTYASFGKDFFATFCGRCHFWTQESAQLDGDLLAGAAGTSTSMPPSAPFPTPDQRMQLVQWLSCGAP
jgi:hypothetical protein